jgi:hypothetical protein
MPQSPTANMQMILPTPGADIGTWDDLLDSAFALIDTHDHSTGKGVPVGVGGLNINGDLTFAGNSAVHLRSADFDEVSSIATGARRIFWSAVDHEMYVRTAAGVNVKITNGAGLNLSATGGIVGDYAAKAAEVAYDDANDRYTFKQENSAGVRQWARLDAADVDIYEYKAAGDTTNITKRVRLKSPAALANSYDVTMPAALPGSQLVLQIDASGNVVVSNTFPGGAVFGAATTVDMSAANAVKDNARSWMVDTGLFYTSTGADSISIGNNARMDASFTLPTNEQITSVVFAYARTSGTITFALFQRTLAGGSSPLCTKTDAASTGNTAIDIGVSPTGGSLPQTTNSTHTYFLRITTDGTGALTLYDARLDSKRLV